MNQKTKHTARRRWLVAMAFVALVIAPVLGGAHECGHDDRPRPTRIEPSPFE